MRDERLERLARMLLTQSLDLRRGEIFEINSGVAANPLNKALLRAAKETCWKTSAGRRTGS